MDGGGWKRFYAFSNLFFSSLPQLYITGALQQQQQQQQQQDGRCKGWDLKCISCSISCQLSASRPSVLTWCSLRLSEWSITMSFFSSPSPVYMQCFFYFNSFYYISKSILNWDHGMEGMESTCKYLSHDCSTNGKTVFSPTGLAPVIYVSQEKRFWRPPFEENSIHTCSMEYEIFGQTRGGEKSRNGNPP